jgi:hypothetical protein
MDGATAMQYVLDNNIEGAICECGVAEGRCPKIFIETLQKNNTTRDIYMYDTYKGLTEPGEFDYTVDGNHMFTMSRDDLLNAWKTNIIDETTNNFCYYPLEKVKANIDSTGYPQDHLHYIIGDVLETLKDVKNIPDKIALLRLDTDWYESSKFELEQMYDKVTPGGVIIFDDYYLWNGQRKATDDFFQSRNIQYTFTIPPDNNGNVASIIKIIPDATFN